MKIRVERDVFAEAVTWTAKSIGAKDTALMQLHLAAVSDDKGARLIVSAADGKTVRRRVVWAEVEEAGEIMVPGALTADIARLLPAAPVSLAVDCGRVAVTCGSARFQLPTFTSEAPHPAARPDADETPATMVGTVEADVFAEAVSQVAIAASRDGNLPQLTGVQIAVDGDQLTLVATDRYRIAVRQISWTPDTAGLQGSFIVPSGTLLDAAKGFAGNAEVRVAFDAGGISRFAMTGAGRELLTNYIEGELPKWQSLFPETLETSVDFAAEALVGALALAQVASQSKAGTTRLTLTNGNCAVAAGQADTASAEADVAVEYDGDEVVIAFNATYLSEAVRATGTDRVVVAFTSPTRPAVVTGKDASDGFRYLLMPVRL